MWAHVWRQCVLTLPLLVLVGCGSPTGIQCPVTTLSETWLSREIDQKFGNGYRFQFPVMNPTSSPVTLKVRSIGCSCYQVKEGDRNLKVGDSITLSAGADTILDLLPPKPQGDGRQFHFSLENHAVPSQVFEFTGTIIIVSETRLSSRRVILDYRDSDQSQKVQLDVTRQGYSAEEVSQIPTVEGWPESSVVDPIRSPDPATVYQGIWKQKFVLTAAIPKPDFSQGDVHYGLSIDAKDGNPKHSVELELKLRSGISHPKLVHFGQVKVGQVATRRIQVASRDDLPFQIRSDGNTTPHVHIRTDSDVPNKTHWVTLTYEGTQPGRDRQILRLNADHPKSPNLEIEILANIVP